MGIPFGFSVSDIAKAIKISREIHDSCYSEDQGAAIKYKEFISDVTLLGNSLERLQGVVNKYEQDPQREWHMGGHDMDAAERLWPQLIGDFHKTLEECESLLRRHGYLRSGRNSFSSGLRWWSSADGAVRDLRARLRFHIDKVDFYTKPAELESIITNGSEIQHLRRQVAQLERLVINGPEQSQTLSANVVSDELKERFEREFQTNSPSWSVSGSEWPLKEAFEAQAFHFAAGTFKFNPPPDLGNVPVVIFVELAKSIWILEEIKKGHQFQAAGTESIWAGRMRRFEDDVRAQLHRFETGELEKPSTQELLELPTSCYSIRSGDKKTANPLSAGEDGPLEEKILEIQLPSDSSNRESALLVFRENDTDFRLVTSTKQADTLMAQYDKEVELNMDRHRLVPAYGNTFQGSSPRYNMLLYNERGRKPKEFVFFSHEDVKKLQRALTGYRVHHDMTVARWRINSSERPGDSGKGILQLWQYKPLPPMSATSPSGSSDGNSSMGSPGSPLTSFPGNSKHDGFRTSQKGRSNSQATSFAAESKGSHKSLRNSSVVSGGTISQSSIISPVRGPHSDGVELSKPELPVLVILTLCNQRYSFVHLTLDASIHVEPRACGCWKPSRHCNRVILERSKEQNFTIRMLIADQEGDRGFESWDLSVFRFPRPEKWRNTTVNEKVKTLELQFTNEDEKNEFLKELTLLENNRTTNHNDYVKSFRDEQRTAR